MRVEAKLEELGLALPEPTKTPQGLVLPFSWVRVRGDRVYLSGHVPLNPDGSFAGPFGKVGRRSPPSKDTRRRGSRRWRCWETSSAPWEILIG
jgi:hypothetical protein